MYREKLRVVMPTSMLQNLNELTAASGAPSRRSCLETIILETISLSPSVVLDTRLRLEVREHLRKLAEEQGLSLSEALRQIIAERW